MRNRFQISPLDFLAAPMIDHQAARDGPQESAGRFQFEAFGALQKSQESVLRVICSFRRVAQPCAQSGVEPAVVTTVKRLYDQLR